MPRHNRARVTPSAAPLGTDDEAAGAPPTGEQVALAHLREIREHGAAPAAPPASERERQGRLVAVGLGLLVACLAAWAAFS